jgi:uncharacterized membrane protein
VLVQPKGKDGASPCCARYKCKKKKVAKKKPKTEKKKQTAKKKTTIKLKIRVTTGPHSGSKYAKSGQNVKGIFQGAAGSVTEHFKSGNKNGHTKTTTYTLNKDIGAIKSLKMVATGTDAWFYTKIEVKSGERAWVELGCTYQWLDKKPFDKGYHWHRKSVSVANAVTLEPVDKSCKVKPPAVPKLAVRVTTGARSGNAYSKTSMKVKGIFTGADGTVTKGFYTGNKNGHTKTTTYTLKKSIGIVDKLKMVATNTNAWYYTKVEVKSGDGPWVNFGCTHAWIDNSMQDTAYTFDGKRAPYFYEVTLKPGTCRMHHPKSWGKPTFNKKCYCKLSGKHGKCGHNGSAYNWCKTRDKCKGAGKGWDYCGEQKPCVNDDAALQKNKGWGKYTCSGSSHRYCKKYKKEMSVCVKKCNLSPTCKRL